MRLISHERAPGVAICKVDGVVKEMKERIGREAKPELSKKTLLLETTFFVDDLL